MGELAAGEQSKVCRDCEWRQPSAPHPGHQSIPPEVNQMFHFGGDNRGLPVEIIWTTLGAKEEGLASQLGEHRAGQIGPEGDWCRVCHTPRQPGDCSHTSALSETPTLVGGHAHRCPRTSWIPVSQAAGLGLPERSARFVLLAWGSGFELCPFITYMLPFTLLAALAF